MGNRSISPQVKRLALDLLLRGFSMEDVSDIFQVSISSLYRWRNTVEYHNAVVRPTSSALRGRPRIIGMAALTAIRALYEAHPDTYLGELQWYLGVYHGISISISALQATLQKIGLHRKLLHKVASERDEAARAAFREMIRDLNHFSGTGIEFVTVDEASKNEHDLIRRYGRAPVGQRADLTEVFVRGQRYSLVAALTTEGYLATRVKEDSYDASSFFDFIIHDVLPRMNPYPGKHSVLVLDNCRIHHIELLAEILNDCGMMLLYLPPYSPDLNPIEESFSSWKAYLKRHKAQIRLADDPEQALLDACGCVTAEMAFQFFRHAGYIVA